MQVIAKSTLRKFWEDHPRSEAGLRGWYEIASKADWASPADVKADYGKGLDFIGDNRVIFDIRRNEFRLIVHMSYEYQRMLIKFVGTHKDYNNINPETV